LIGGMLMKIQVKVFYEEDKANDFLLKLDPENVIDVKIAASSYDGEGYEAIMVVYKKEFN
jgi:hypothetical protein